MRNFAIILCLICAGYYGWESFEQWLVESDPQVRNGKEAVRSEVFPEAMSNIVPITNLSEHIKQQREQAALREQKRQEELRLQKELQEKKDAEQAPKPIPVPVLKPEEITEESQNICWRIGPVSNKSLPAINRSIESAKLLENVRVEAVLSSDSFIVFIIPTTTKRGAQALANQVRKQGYRSAYVISEGPLLNAVQLGRFSEEAQAQKFFEEAKDRLKMRDLRLTRQIGKPTDKVNLIFTSLSDKQTDTLKGLARRHGQTLRECEF